MGLATHFLPLFSTGLHYRQRSGTRQRDMLKKTRDNSDLDHISWSATDIVSSRAESSCYMALLISAQSDAAVAVLFVFVFARERLLGFFLKHSRTRPLRPRNSARQR